MIDGIGSSFTGLIRSASYSAARQARVNQQETTPFSIEHAVPKDSITIRSDLSANPVAAPSSSEKSKNGNGQLSDGEQQQVQELKTRDAEVRAHEQAHAATGGTYAGATSYTESRGPDGHSYAIGGEVSIDSAPIAGDPEASIPKLNTVIAAALAPVQPSGQDQAVAAQARTNLAQAYTELREKNFGNNNEDQKTSKVSGLQYLLKVQEYPETTSDPSALLLNATQAYQAVAV